MVGGWTPGEGDAKELGAVVVGVYEGERLRFAGQGRARGSTGGRARSCGRGSRRSRPTRRRSTRRPPPDYRGRWGGDLAGVRWIRPELVIRAEIGGWTRDGHVRQTAFKGLELGRDPREVVRERAVDPARAEREAEASASCPSRSRP